MSDAYGFTWGPVVVERVAIFPTHHVVRVNNLEIYVSPTGRSVRVFRSGAELKPAVDAEFPTTPKDETNA